MWKDLNMRERAAFIKLAVDSGMYSIKDIVNTYNEYAEGGSIRSYKDFSTRLSRAWNNQDLSKDDYDYQKYYNDNPIEAYKQLEAIEHGSKGHFPDGGRSGTYKTPNHPTYPDLGSNSWLDNDRVFNMSARQASKGLDNIESELNTDRILDYLGSDLHYNNGFTRAMYNGAYQLPSITVTPKGNYTDLIPNELGTGWMYRDRAGRYSDFNYDYVNKFKEGGYKPSSSIMKRISDWEGSSMKTNRSFEAEAKDFNASLPQGATSKLSQSQLDGLFSYSYNVGAGNFRKRVNPMLTKYLAGQATIQDVQKSMWASKDSQLRGLAKRRNAERAMLGNYTPTDYTSKNISPLSNTTAIGTNQILPEEIEIPQLQFSEAFNNPSPVDLEPSLAHSSLGDIDFNEPSGSLANVLDMIQMIKSPRQINIHT